MDKIVLRLSTRTLPVRIDFEQSIADDELDHASIAGFGRTGIGIVDVDGSATFMEPQLSDSAG